MATGASQRLSYLMSSGAAVLLEVSLWLSLLKALNRPDRGKAPTQFKKFRFKSLRLCGIKQRHLCASR